MKMLGLFLSTLLLLFFIDAQCQELDERSIRGVWQIRVTEVTSGLLDNYKFLEGNKFEFQPSAYEGLNRTISLNGVYEVKKDSLVLTIKSITELTGGLPSRSTTVGGSGWEISDGKPKTTLFTIPIRYTLTLKVCSNKETSRCLLLDSIKFYEIKL